MKQYSIVGMDHQKSGDIVKALQPGAPLVLVHEPLNQYDRNAIAVWSGDRKIGYIPKKQNGALAQFIDQTGGNAALTADMAGLAMDSAGPDPKAITAEFIRSPNSGYPLVGVTG